MEADAPQWNAMSVDKQDQEMSEKEMTNRKRVAEDVENMMVTAETARPRPNKSTARSVGVDVIPPSIVDTGALVREGHPAFTSYLRDRYQMGELGQSQWVEKDAFQHSLEMMDKLQASSQQEDNKDEFITLRNAFLDNRKNFEALKKKAEEMLDSEQGPDWRQENQWLFKNNGL